MDSSRSPEAQSSRGCGRLAALQGALVLAIALLGLGNQWGRPLATRTSPDGRGGGPGARPRAVASLRLLTSGQAADDGLTLVADEMDEVERAREQDAAELQGGAPEHEGRAAAPEHGGRAAAPEHGGRAAAPEHGGRAAAPEHGGRAARGSGAEAAGGARPWRRGPSPHVERQSEGHPEWVVVFGSGPVNVRSAMALSASVLGRRVEGDVVFGRREGEWLALAHERGYIKRYLEDPPTTLLERRTAVYVQLASGRCSETHHFPIRDTRACRAAASALGYPGASLHIYEGSKPRPEGCYVSDGELWMARGTSSMGNGVLGEMKPLCSSTVYPSTSPAP